LALVAAFTDVSTAIETAGASNNATVEYETLDLFMFQSFFDTLSQDFIPPLLENLAVITIPHFPFKKNATGEYGPGVLDILGDFEIDYEMWDLKLASASISPTPSIITIENGFYTLAITDLTLNMTADYTYITNPPLFADIGEANIVISNLTASSDVTSYLHATSSEENFELTFTNQYIDSGAEPLTKFDGISDFSDVVTNVVNTLAAVVRNRLDSFINGGELYSIDAKIEAVINKIIGLIPSQFDLGGSGLYFDGWLYSNIVP
jgi:hypothetical protein